jgi:hypothetical protein
MHLVVSRRDSTGLQNGRARFLQIAVVDPTADTLIERPARRVKTDFAQFIIIEPTSHQLHEGFGPWGFFDAEGCFGLIPDKDDPARWNRHIHAPHAIGGRPHVGHDSFSLRPANRTHRGLLAEALNDRDRLVLQAHGADQRIHQPVVESDQRHLIRQQAPARQHQGGAQRALPRPGVSQNQQRLTAPFQHPRMQNQIGIQLTINGEVHSPFQE